MLRSTLSRGTASLLRVNMTVGSGRLSVLIIEWAASESWVRIGPEKMSLNPDGGCTYSPSLLLTVLSVFIKTYYICIPVYIERHISVKIYYLDGQRYFSFPNVRTVCQSTSSIPSGICELSSSLSFGLLFRFGIICHGRDKECTNGGLLLHAIFVKVIGNISK